MFLVGWVCRDEWSFCLSRDGSISPSFMRTLGRVWSAWWTARLLPLCHRGFRRDSAASRAGCPLPRSRCPGRGRACPSLVPGCQPPAPAAAGWGLPAFSSPDFADFPDVALPSAVNSVPHAPSVRATSVAFHPRSRLGRP